MAFTGSFEDKQRIRELFDTYSDAVTRQDVERYLACWTEGCRRTGSGGECCGKAELRAHWEGSFQAIDKMAFFTQAASITVDGNHATAESYCLEILRLRDGIGRQLVGHYTDELIRSDGDWFFAQRHYEVVLTF
jgi:ketosteroid isomerase-like protein